MFESRDIGVKIVIIHSVISKFDIAILDFNKIISKISMVNMKYDDSLVRRITVGKDDMLLSKLSKKFFNNKNSECDKLRSVFEKLT